MSAGPTPSQTVGPYFSIGLPWDDGPHAVAPGADGAITIAGHVLDGAGDPVPDALIETWQTDPPAGDGFRGFARAPADDDGRYALTTLKPGAVGGQAPHLAVTVLGRGMLHRVVTRIYFADEAEANAHDRVLTSVPADRRATLLATPGGDGSYRFDLRLQGPGETVFFDV